MGFKNHFLLLLIVILCTGASKKNHHQSYHGSARLSDDVVDFLYYRLREVKPGKFYRSAQLSNRKLEFCLKKLGIKTIINLRGKHPELAWWRDEKALAERYHAVLIDLPLSAKVMPSKKFLKELFEIFDTAQYYPILAHCCSGVDRSGIVAALWLMDHEHESYEVAKKQLSFRYFHAPRLWGGGVMDFFLKLWQSLNPLQKGRDWALNHYNPDEYKEIAAKLNAKSII